MSKTILNLSLLTGILGLFLIVSQPVAFGEEGLFLDFPIGLKIGETVNIDSNLKITLLDIQDSRCPSDVVCVWEGTVSAKIQLEKGTQDLGVHTISLETVENNEKVFDGFYIRLTNVEPYPVSTTPIPTKEYVLTFFLSKAEINAIDSPLKQFKNGVQFKDIKCNTGLQLTQRYDDRPACVKSTTYFELIKRDWVSEIIKAIQSGDFSDKDKDQQTIQPVIKTGTKSGFCLGYCTKEFVISPDKIIYTQGGREIPDLTKEIKFSKSAWNNLLDLIDFEKFILLPDKVGCPGCADAPVEWIEISFDEKTKRIEFEKGDQIPEIKKLIETLEKIRNPIESSIENFEDCAAAGNPIMESYPRQCRTDDGRNFVEEIDFQIDLQSQCKNYGGNWLVEFNECEWISEEQCSEMNGEFKECESACRHDENAQVCTLQCVQVCLIP